MIELLLHFYNLLVEMPIHNINFLHSSLYYVPSYQYQQDVLPIFVRHH